MLLQLHFAAYWLFLLHTSKIVNYGSNSLEIQYVDGQQTLQHVRGFNHSSAAYCCILWHNAAY